MNKICVQQRKNTDSSTRPNIATVNMGDKFRAYRLIEESFAKKLKEAEILVQQLRDELNFSRNLEKTLKSQLSSMQDRLICQERMLKKFTTVYKQQQQNEKFSDAVEKKIEELVDKINQTREQSQNVLKYVTREVDLVKKIKQLESVLNRKDSEYGLEKMELLKLTKEKETMEIERSQFQKKVKELENELEKSIKKEAETLAHSREVLLFYRRQIEDYEQKVERYEKERKSFLEDFEPPRGPKTTTENFAVADSTVKLDSGERSGSPKKLHKTQIEMDDPDDRAFQPSSFLRKSKLPTFKRGKGQNLQRLSTKPKPQLEFLTAPLEDSSRAVPDCGRKRRLFSTNCNHYID